MLGDRLGCLTGPLGDKQNKKRAGGGGMGLDGVAACSGVAGRAV